MLNANERQVFLFMDQMEPLQVCVIWLLGRSAGFVAIPFRDVGTVQPGQGFESCFFQTDRHPDPRVETFQLCSWADISCSCGPFAIQEATTCCSTSLAGILTSLGIKFDMHE